MELLVLIDQGIGLIKGISVRVGKTDVWIMQKGGSGGILRVAVQFTIGIISIGILIYSYPKDTYIQLS